MGKQKPFNYTLSDMLGPNIGSNPAVQAAQVAQNLRSSQKTVSTDSIIPETSKPLTYDARVYENYLNPNDYGMSPEQMDKQVAENQSGFKQIINGAIRFVPAVAVKLLQQGEGIVQAADFGVNALKMKADKDSFAESEFGKGVESFDTYIKNALPIYATEKYKEGSLLEQMTTAKFWADDVVDGVAFIAAQAIGTKGLGAVLGSVGKGAQMVANATRASEIIAGTSKAAQNAAKVANAISNNYTVATAGLVNAGFSGALQAQDTRRQIVDALTSKINPDTGVEYTKNEINEIAAEKAANTFKWTFAAHIGPGLYESKTILGLGKDKLTGVRAKIVEAVENKDATIGELLEGVNRNVLKKSVWGERLTEARKGALIEGLWEENVENAIQKYDTETGINGKHTGWDEEAANYAMKMLTFFGSKEDSKAVILGALLGGPFGALGAGKNVSNYNQQVDGLLDSLRASDAHFGEDIRSMYKTYPVDVVEGDKVKHKKGDLVLDEKGEPIDDVEAQAKMIFQTINSKNLFDRQVMAMVDGNKDLATMNENVAISASVFRELGKLTGNEDAGDALTFLKWRMKKAVEEQTSKEQTKADTDEAATVAVQPTDESQQSQVDAEQAAGKAKAQTAQFNGKDRANIAKVVNENLSKIDDMAKAYKNAQEATDKLISPAQKKAVNAFTGIIKKGLFYEAVKRMSFDEMIRERQKAFNDEMSDKETIAKEIDSITKLKQDSLDKSKKYIEDPKSLMEAYSGRLGQIAELGNIINENIDSENEKKSRKKDTAKYQLDEIAENEGLRTEQNAGEFSVNHNDINEEIQNVPMAQRSSKPIGKRNEFFWKAANDHSKLQVLNTKISQYESGALDLKSLMNYAHDNITNIDDETNRKLLDIIDAEKAKADLLKNSLDNMDSTIMDEDTFMVEENPAYAEAVVEYSKVSKEVSEAEAIVKDIKPAAELNLALNAPDKIEKHLVEQFALTKFDKGNYVIANALNEDGSVREDYADIVKISLAIRDLTTMANAIEDRLDNGDLKKVTGLSYLIKDARDMIDRLKGIQDEVVKNQKNRDNYQAIINSREADTLTMLFKLDNPVSFSARTIYGEGFDEALKQIDEMPSNRYEASMALIETLRTKATAEELSELKKLIETQRDVLMLELEGLTGEPQNYYAFNPQREFSSFLWKISATYRYDGYPVMSLDKNSPLNTYDRTNNLEVFEKAIKDANGSKDLGMPENVLKGLLEIHKKLLSVEKVGLMLKVEHKPLVQEQLKFAETETITPTTEQEIAIREIRGWLKNRFAKSKFGNYAFLRGIAGTGKTNIVLKWALANSGIDINDIMVTALTSTATDVISNSTGAKGMVFSELVIPENIKLLVIDEYATIPYSQMMAMEETLRNAGIKVLLLGDPTQITPNDNGESVTNAAFNVYASNITTITPVTSVYRSDVSAVNDASNLFQDNNQAVTNVVVAADKPMGQALAKGSQIAKSSQDIRDAIARNVQAEIDNGLTPRTRVIIVEKEEDFAKYDGMKADLLTVYNAQSKTYDEVYVDLEEMPTGSKKELTKRNTAMYTALSRAKLYSMFIFGDGKNTVDSSLNAEYLNNKETSNNAKDNFIKAKNFELSLMESLSKGKTVKETQQESEKKQETDPIDLLKPQESEDEEPEVLEEPDDEGDGDLPVVDDDAIDVDPDNPSVKLEPNDIIIGGANDYGIDNFDTLDNVEGSAYPLIKSQTIGTGTEVIYVPYIDNDSQQLTVAVMADNGRGGSVVVGKIFKEELESYPKHQDLKTAIPEKPFNISKDNLKTLTSTAFSEVRNLSIKSGKIKTAEHLRFSYRGKSTDVTGTIAEHIKNLFESKFYNKVTSSANPIFKIFTKADVDKAGKGSILQNIKLGRAYAIVGAIGNDYSNAKFVDLQANNISKDNPLVQSISKFVTSVENLENLSGITLGSTQFNTLVRAMKNSLEIKEESINTGVGGIKTTYSVKAKPDFKYEELLRIAEELMDKDKIKGSPDLFSKVPKEFLQDAIGVAQDVAMQLYGVKTVEREFTEEEITEDMVAVPTLRKKVNKEGATLFYAKLKDAEVKHGYIKKHILSSDNGPAQLALDQIARANEFIGNTPIRVRKYTDRSTPTYKAKSLITDKGGSTRLYSLLTLLSNYGPLFGDPNWKSYTPAARRQAIRDMVYELMEDDSVISTTTKIDSNDMINVMNRLVEERGDEELKQQAKTALSKKDVKPLSLDLLKLLTDDSNYESGAHQTKAMPVKNKKGEIVLKPTFVRTPLLLKHFNTLGQDPVANAEALGKLVHTKFSDILPTKVVVEKSSNQSSIIDIEPQIENFNGEPVLDLGEDSTFSPNSFISEDGEDDFRLAFSETVPRDKGSLISAEAAVKDLKRMIPNITTEEYEFLSKAVIDKFANPNENLIGLFDKGKILLAEYDGKVYSKVLRHEAMHKIFNEYLTNEERELVRLELDPKQTLTRSELDEKMADLFMEHQQTPEYSTFLGKLFAKILEWVKSIYNNKTAVQQIFDNIEKGKYTKQLNKSVYRAAFSDVRENYGSVNMYKNAVKLIENEVDKTLLNKDIDILPLTLQETQTYVAQKLLKRRQDIFEYLKPMSPEVRATHKGLMQEFQILNKMFKTNSDKTINYKVFNETWKDLYPNFQFKAGEGAGEVGDFDTEYDGDEVGDGSGMRDYIMQSDEHDNESKLTDNVKNFLTFLKYPSKNKEGKLVWKKINPRYAYLECLRTIGGLITSDPKANLLDQIDVAAKYNGINPNSDTIGAHVIKAIKKLILDAENEGVITKAGLLSLERTSRFYSNDVFGFSADKQLSKISYETAKGDSTIKLFGRKRGESTPQFVKRIATETNMEVAKVTAYFKQHQAQETLREVMTVFLSQRESNPLIAEEYKEGEFGSKQMVLRYFKAQFYGTEQVIANDIKKAIKNNWDKLTPEDWAKAKLKNQYADKIDVILKKLNLDKDVELYRDFNNSDVWHTIEGFNNRLEALKEDGKYPILSGQDGEGEVIYKDAEWLLGQENSFIAKLTDLLQYNLGDGRPSKYKSADGKTKYVFHNSSQALDSLQRLIGVTGIGRKLQGYNKGDSKFEDVQRKERVKNGLPPHLRSAWGSHNIFVNGLNVVHKIVDHDGMRVKDREEFAKSYADETESESLQRQFAYGFLNYARVNVSSNSKNLKYIQYFYTLSNRPRMMGGEVNILTPSQIYGGLHSMLNQLLEQSSTISNVKNYSRYKTINAELMGEAIDVVMGGRNAETYEKLIESKELRNQVVKTFLDLSETKVKAIANKLVDEKVFIGDNALKTMQMLKRISEAEFAENKMYSDYAHEITGKEIEENDEPTSEFEDMNYSLTSNKWDRQIGYTAESIAPAIRLWYLNNYVNGYNLNQTVVGNYNFFKDAEDIVKRMSGVFAPGIRGYATATGDFFMRKNFKVAIMSDPRMLSSELSAVFKNSGVEKSVQADDKEGGFEYLDGQGFMTPKRAENLLAGLGSSYKRGAIYKAAHYEIVEINGEYVPLMVKYSCAILSDELCAAHPKLARLREKMEASGVDELIFDSGTKVGKPLETRQFPTKDEDWVNYELPTSAMVDLSNENYRLQLNPNHQTVSEEGEIGKVSSPTQLTFFANLLNHVDKISGTKEGEKASEENKKRSDKIYKSLANLYAAGLEKMSKKLTSTGKIKKSAIQATLTGAGNERASELLKEVGYNIPILTDKVLIQIMNLFAKTCVKPKFEGGKFTLQSSYGIEMIKPNSVEYAALDNVQKAAHDSIWTAYGNRERNKQEGGARRLEYKTDEHGQLYAEVLIDKAYAEQIGVGDFMLPDMLAYRIPSTELHSSIALRVAGHYDSKGSNVIIAPAELVKHHGSDFDVDALYVINRERHKLNIDGVNVDYPIGYAKDHETGLYVWDESYIQDYMNTLSFLFGDKEMGGTYKGLYDTLYEKLNRNRIVENFLQLITDSNNRDRMLEPIDTKPLKDVIKELELSGKTGLDLSDALDNLKMFKSNFQGLRLTGIFANAVKGLAYMVKAGENGGYPKVQVDENGEEKEFVLFQNTYKGFTELLPNKDTIWKILDALINTSVDNVKDQLLGKINASNQTGKTYAAGLSSGIPLKDLVVLHLNPVALAYSDNKGDINVVRKLLEQRFLELYGDAAKPEMKEKIDKQIARSIKRAENQEGYVAKTEENLVGINLLDTYAQSYVQTTLEDAKKIMNKSISELTFDEVIHQANILRVLSILNTRGEALSKFSAAVGVIQDFPVKYDRIEELMNKWASIGTINEEGQFVAAETFPYQLPELFNSQPNIAEGFRAFNKAVEVVDTSLMRHLPAMKGLVNSIIEDTNIKLSYKGNIESLKNEVISFMLSGMYAKENEQEEQVTYQYRGRDRQVSGKAAWSHRFAESLEPWIDHNKKLAKESQNNFLNKLTVSEKYGLKYISFESSSNDTYLDNLEMQEGFDMLFSPYGETTEQRKANTEALKANLVRYAVMNYGLKFGSKNFSNVIPAEYLHDVDNYLRQMEGIIRNSNIQADKNEGLLSKIKDSFLLRLAVNNPENLPFISAKKVEPVKHPDGRTINVKGDTPGMTKVLPDLKGLENGYYYNRKFENPLIAGSDKTTYDEKTFPKFIRTSDDVVMIRLNSATDKFVYYQKLGTKNWAGGYEMSSNLYREGYNINDYFKPYLTPIAVANNKDEQFIVANRDLSIGDRVIVYNFNDESRKNGRIGIIKALEEVSSADHTVTFTIEDEVANQSENMKNFYARFDKVKVALESKFGIPINVVSSTNMPDGYRDRKGLVMNGQVYINGDIAGWDTPFHEISHVVVWAIMKQNPTWMAKLVQEYMSSEESKMIKRNIDIAYPDMTPDEKTVEGLVQLMGMVAADASLTTNLFQLVRRLLRGIRDIMLKAIEGIRKGKFTITGNHLADPQMVNLSIEDLAAIIASSDNVIKLDLKEYLKPDMVFEQRSQESNNSEKSGIEQRILDHAKTIVNPEIDDKGNQGNFYKIKGDAIQRVSNFMGSFTLRKKDMLDASGKEYVNETEAYIHRLANSKFKNLGENDTYLEEGIAYTKQAYIDFKRAVFKQGKLKGDLIHALLQYQTNLINNKTEGMEELTRRIAELENESTTAQGSYNWVLSDKVFPHLMKNAGINIASDLPIELRDRILSEVTVGDTDLGIAGKVDKMVIKPNGNIKIVDYKTGNRFDNNKLNAEIFNYGNQEFNLYSTPMGRAKLQVMLYSVAIKASHPDARLERPVILHIPNEISATNPNNAHEVEVRDYLEMIRLFYKNERPKEYAKLIEKSPNLFNPSHYGASINSSFTQDVLDRNGKTDTDLLKMYELELEQLVTSVELRKMEDNTYKRPWEAEELKRREQLGLKILQARSVIGLPNHTSSDYELSKFTTWLGTLQDTHNPYIQAYANVVSQARVKVYEDYDQVQRKFDSMLAKVIEENLGKQNAITKALMPIDKLKFWQKFIVDTTKVDEDGLQRFQRGLITEDSVDWNKLSKSEKELVTYMRDSMSEIFHSVLVSGPNAVVGTNRKGNPRTKLDVYNRSVGGGFVYDASFIPKVAITAPEVKWKLAKQGIVKGGTEYIKHAIAKNLSMFYEENESGTQQKQYGIPIKYLGSNASNHNPDIHSSDLEIVYKTFMQHMINKKHYDSVYALGEATKGYLAFQRDKNGNKINEAAAEFVGYHMKRNLVGRLNSSEGDFVRKPFKLPWIKMNGAQVFFSPMKLMRVMSTGVAQASLYLNPTGAFKNAAQAMWAVSKESMVQSISTTEWAGMKGDTQSLSAVNIDTYNDWRKYQGDLMQGKGKANPVHVFVKTFRMYPELTELGYKSRGMLMDNGKALKIDNLSILYSAPEEATTAILAINMMKTLKIESGPYKGKSMWEVYSSNIKVDENSGEGFYNLPDDFTRGKLRMGDGSLQELKGMTPFEIQKLHGMVKKVKGGYRTEERSMLEATMLGEAFMLFRRWLPANMLEGWKSKHYSTLMGDLQKAEGEDIYEWRARVVEGRWRTLGGFIGNVTGMAQFQGYKWADMSQDQRRNIIDGAITLSTWLVAVAIVGAAFRDDDDDEPMKVFSTELAMKLIEQWNVVSSVEAATKEPAVVRGVMQLFTGMAQMGAASYYAATGGDESDIYTKRGDFRGLNNFMKSLPVGAGIWNGAKFIKNSEYFESEDN